MDIHRREPGPVKGGNTVIAFVVDPDGYKIELIQRSVGPGIEVQHVGATGLWTVLVDVPQLESALLNLCINARDAMPTGGKITIETGNRWIDRAQAGWYYQNAAGAWTRK